MYGVDFASVDGNKVDYDKLRETPFTLDGVNLGRCTFITHRASFADEFIDPRFVEFWKTAKAEGFVRGAYMFWKARRDGQRQIDLFLRAMEKAGGFEPGDLCPWFDVEFQGSRESQGLDADVAFQRAYETGNTLAARTGGLVGWYTSERIWRSSEELASPEKRHPKEVADLAARTPLWLARYDSVLKPPPVPAPWGPSNYWIDQTRGDTPNVPGISHQADINLFNVLKPGAKDGRVAFMQRRLGCAVTGEYDDVTQWEVEAFQGKHGLKQDGLVGPKTFGYLCHG